MHRSLPRDAPRDADVTRRYCSHQIGVGDHFDERGTVVREGGGERVVELLACGDPLTVRTVQL